MELEKLLKETRKAQKAFFLASKTNAADKQQILDNCKKLEIQLKELATEVANDNNINIAVTDWAAIILNMLSAQACYFKTRTTSDLKVAKYWEQRVDKSLSPPNLQTELFGFPE